MKHGMLCQSCIIGKENKTGREQEGRAGHCRGNNYGYTGNIQHELKAFDVRRRKSKNTCSAYWAMSSINHACINATRQPVDMTYLFPQSLDVLSSLRE